MKLLNTLCSFVISIPVMMALNSQTVVAQPQLSSYVNPFIGTDGFGHTFPGASRPFGMVQLSPDTRTTGWENCSGYHSSNKTILGFSHTHLSGTGAADYGDILVMATSGVQTMPGDEEHPLDGYRSLFSHDSEKAAPGYYKVKLDDHNITAELTTTTRCGFHKYTFPQSENSVILIDLVHGISDQVTDASITINDNHTISGFRRSKGWAKNQVIFFYAEFSKNFAEAGIADASGKTISEKTLQNTSGMKSWVKFTTKNNEAILLKVGISTVSIENARLNLKTEIPGWEFMKVVSDAKSEWDKELGRIVVEGGTTSDNVNFYTSLYHVLLAPNIMSDVDGRYTGMDGAIHKMERGNMYTVFSLWDTFRALHPLYTVIDPDRAQDFIRALLLKYKESGLLPVWELGSNETNCMIGYHSVPVIVDAYNKGLKDFDANLALEAMIKSSMQDNLGMKYYKVQGYVPADRENESVSRTLEYAYDDWCIATMADKMGKSEIAATYYKRGQNFKNVYDMPSGFMRGKKNGNWVTPFDPAEVSGIYTEANAWQYTWFAPHDPATLVSLMGGKHTFGERLDTLFSTSTVLKGNSQPDISGMIGQYAHGNEPSHHMAYLYNWSDAPYKTAQLVRKIMKEFYTNQRDGLIGNEDCGQMSAWFVFSAMGFYPVCPGANTYAFGSPLFKKITINPGTSKKFIVEADNVSDRNIYTKSAAWNGNPQNGTLNHSQIASGGTLHFTMQESPVGIPFAETASDKKQMVMSPFIKSCDKAFLDSCKIEMYSYTRGATIRYTTDGSEPGPASALYSQPVYIYNSTQLKMTAFKEGMEASFPESVSFLKLPYKRTIAYKYPYSHLYTAGGANGLIDGLHGEPSIFGGWQGFYGDDFEAVVDLGQQRNFSKISSTFLQQYPAWIWLPTEVTYSVSTDGVSYREVYSQKNSVGADASGSFTKSFDANVPGSSARFVKVTAKNIGKCPPWHPGAGEKAWIFIDEIEVE